MFQMFNLNFNNFYKKENSTKFISLGIVLLFLSVISFFYKGLGIKLVSWTFATLLLFLAYLNLTNINELKRYASKSEIEPYTRIQFFMVAGALLLLIFPEKVQGFVSFLLGWYLMFGVISKYLANKDNPYYRFGFSQILNVIFSATLILSPLFLSSFIASIMSFIVFFIALFFISTGNKLKN